MAPSRGQAREKLCYFFGYQYFMAADVTTSPTFTASAPKVLFKLPGPLGGNLGNISPDGQRFVFAVNVPAGGTK